jgi:hypothetical protein
MELEPRCVLRRRIGEPRHQDDWRGWLARSPRSFAPCTRHWARTAIARPLAGIRYLRAVIVTCSLSSIRAASGPVA